MKAFWTGFEKQALSPGLVRRAEAASKLRLKDWIHNTSLSGKLSDEGVKKLKKLTGRTQRFGDYARNKEWQASHSAHMDNMKDVLQKQTDEHLKPLKDMLEKNK